MGFNSVDYILFLIIVFLIFWQISKYRNARNTFILIASYLFYTAWNGYFVFILLFSTFIDYYCGKYIYTSSQRKRKIYLFISILSNLSVLCFFKYINFFISNSNSLFTLLDINSKIPNLSLLLPIGISFYTFQSMSYSLDLYFKKCEPVKNFREFALFVSFFPQLVAGPIVRASEFISQLAPVPTINNKELGEAFFLILKGLVKKIIIADYLNSAIVGITFQNPELYNATEITYALLAFHFQVYCDFSGYTDIAIGSAKLFGFKLPINFNSPYKAHSPANFWKRWHMTLSRFAFDYIYKPLGGSKNGVFKTYRNIIITFVLIGFWHGANWNYILFGLYHAVGVCFCRFFKEENWSNFVSKNKIALIFLTNIYVILSLPLFRSTNLKQAGQIYSGLLKFNDYSFHYSMLSVIFFLLAVIGHYIPHKLHDRIVDFFADQKAIVQVSVILIVAYFIYLVSELKSFPFIYLQF